MPGRFGGSSVVKQGSTINKPSGPCHPLGDRGEAPAWIMCRLDTRYSTRAANRNQDGNENGAGRRCNLLKQAVVTPFVTQ
jgi:hypothetical protein